MAGEDFSERLTPGQYELLESFLAIDPSIPVESAGQVHAFDQATSYMKERFVEEGASLNTTEDFFSTVAGLNIGTILALGLVEREPTFTIGQANNVLQVALDRLAPASAQRFDAPEEAAHISWYDQASSHIRDLLSARLQLDVSNPHVFRQITAGMMVGVEWMEKLVEQGYTPDYAALMTLAVMTRLVPPQS